MAAASYHPQILSPKYEKTGNVRWPNVGLKASNVGVGTLVRLSASYAPINFHYFSH